VYALIKFAENENERRSIKLPTDISMVSICTALTAPSRLAERASCRPFIILFPLFFCSLSYTIPEQARNFTRRAEFAQWKEKRFEFEIRRTNAVQNYRAKLHGGLLNATDARGSE